MNFDCDVTGHMCIVMYASYPNADHLFYKYSASFLQNYM